MNLKIEDIRKCLSSVATWLTFDEDTRFFKDDRNIPSNENGKGLAKQLDIYSVRSRKLFNALSESLEDTATCRKTLRYAIEREKEMKKNKNRK